MNWFWKLLSFYLRRFVKISLAKLAPIVERSKKGNRNCNITAANYIHSPCDHLLRNSFIRIMSVWIDVWQMSGKWPLALLYLITFTFIFFWILKWIWKVGVFWARATHKTSNFEILATFKRNFILTANSLIMFNRWYLIPDSFGCAL